MEGPAVVAFQGSQHPAGRRWDLPLLGPPLGVRAAEHTPFWSREPFDKGVILHSASLLNQ